MASTYTWLAGSGLWGDGADWADATDPGAGTAPRAGDTATIAGPATGVDVVYGPGSAATLTTTGRVAFAGAVTVGHLATTFGQAFGQTDIVAGSTLVAASSDLTGVVQVSGPGASFAAGAVSLGAQALVVQDHASFRAASLLGKAGQVALIVVDATASAEIGGGALATAGTLAIDAGATLSMSGTIDAAIRDDGTLETTGNLTLGGATTGTGQVLIEGLFSSLTMGATGAGLTVGFGGYGQTLALSGTERATVTGFAVGDQIETSTVAIDAATYTATGNGLGTLALTRDGLTVETITLAGNYTGATFLVVPGSTARGAPTGAVVLAASGIAAPTAAPIDTGTHDFYWQLSPGGSWSDAANWTTPGAVAKVGGAPGATDSATLNAVGDYVFGTSGPIGIVNGNGNAATLTVQGAVALNGAFTTRTLIVNGGLSEFQGTLDLLAGTVLSAASATIAGAVLVGGAGARLSVAGQLGVTTQIEVPSLDVVDGGRVTAGSLVLSGGTATVDAASGVEVGGVGRSVNGAIAVDAGGLLTISGDTVEAAIVNNGTVLAGGGSGSSLSEVTGAVYGSGTLEVGFQRDLMLTNRVATSQTLGFVGAFGTLDITNAGSIGSPVTGLAVTDGFEVGGEVTGVRFVRTGLGAGILTMTDASGAAVQTLGVAGALDGNSFVLLPQGGLHNSTPAAGQRLGASEVILAGGSLQVGPPPPPAPGTATGQDFGWAAKSGGAWNSAANWGSASVPGSLDTVTFAYATPNGGVVSGSGNAASVLTTVPIEFSGVFDFGSLDIRNGIVHVTAGTTLQVGSLQGGVLDVTGAGASLGVSGLAYFGSGPSALALTHGAHGQVAKLNLSYDARVGQSGESVAVDATSTLEVGAVGGTLASGLTVDAGQATGGDGDWTLVGAIHNGGTISALSTGVITGPVDGNGTIEVAQDGTLTIDGSVAASQTIELTGGSATLILSGPIDAAIVGFDASDTIELPGFLTRASYVATGDGVGRLVLSDGAAPVAGLTLIGNCGDPLFLTQARPPAGFQPTEGTSVVLAAACFAEGTRIAVASGDLPIEQLRPGDLVRTRDHGLRPVQWVGHRRTDCRRHPSPRDVWPVEVAADAFGPGRPRRALFLSPDHAIHIAGLGGPDVLVPVRHLLNGATIRQHPVDHVTYWHVELASHDVVLAEGLACESYLDTGNRGAFDNGGPAVALHPMFARATWAEHACAELVTAGPIVVAMHAALLARAGALGHAITTDVGLVVRAKSRPLRLTALADGWITAELPTDGRSVEFLSRAAVPAHHRTDDYDHRRLGVAIAELRLDDEPVPLTDPRLGGGWHAAEPDRRWTAGAATLETGRAARLSFRSHQLLAYWLSRPPAPPRQGRAAARAAR